MAKSDSTHKEDAVSPGLDSPSSNSDKNVTILTREGSPNENADGTQDAVGSTKTVIPPIVTYPEFLISPHPAPAPLITTTRLLTTIYASSLLAAALCGTQRYTNFMLDRLADCRHELFGTALSQLDTLSAKLEALVSEIPAKAKKTRKSDGEEDEDPSELFHRDIGVQTSPSLHDDSGFRVKDSPPHDNSFITHQSNNLASMCSSLKEVSCTLADENKNDVNLNGILDDLRSYLNTLAYQTRPETSYGNHFLTKGLHAQETDEITEIRKEIKSMKGLLLSTRTFPGAQRIALNR